MKTHHQQPSPSLFSVSYSPHLALSARKEKNGPRNEQKHPRTDQRMQNLTHPPGFSMRTTRTKVDAAWLLARKVEREKKASNWRRADAIRAPAPSFYPREASSSLILAEKIPNTAAGVDGEHKTSRGARRYRRSSSPPLLPPSSTRHARACTVTGLSQYSRQSADGQNGTPTENRNPREETV